MQSFDYSLDEQAGPLVYNFSQESRTFTFDYGLNITPFEGTELEFYDFDMTVIASTGISTEITSESSFTLRVINPCYDPDAIKPPQWLIN